MYTTALTQCHMTYAIFNYETDFHLLTFSLSVSSAHAFCEVLFVNKTTHMEEKIKIFIEKLKMSDDNKFPW